MNSFFRIRTLLLSVIIIIFTSCQKEGPPGKDGKDGNANVVSTSFTSSSWTYSEPSWVISINWLSITPDIINGGAVLVYLKDGNDYKQLPLTFYSTPEYSTTIEVTTRVSGLSLYWTDSDLIQPLNPGLQTFKIVLIAPSALMRNPNVDYLNYEEVKSTFNLED